ncbi:hypothetical protein LCGC14_2621870 [marine sediment metagenome]|uniref:Uncharacterized protein n=1 Tax=marine sediment metagenome TaxID=412755 RepID=A0A0F9AQG4_9ZZZZ
MSFTDQKPRVATEHDIHAKWSGEPDGQEFYCKLCGYVFQIGDVWRWVYGGSVINFIVCQVCDTEDVLEKWKQHGRSGWIRYQQRLSREVKGA